MDYRLIDLKVRISICRGEHTTKKINGTSRFSIFSSPELLIVWEHALSVRLFPYDYT